MNARVFLLVLVTGSFMAIWNSDQEAMQAALARRQKAVQTEIALGEELPGAFIHADEQGTHQVTAEWEAFVSDMPAVVDATQAVIDITPSDLADAEEVEVIELQSDLALVPAVRSFVAPNVVLESWVQTIAPEDLCVHTNTTKTETSDADPFLLADVATSGFELKHVATQLANPVLASIGDALAQHDQDDSEGEDVCSSEDDVPTDVPVALEATVEEPIVSEGPATSEVVSEPVHEEAAHEAVVAEPVVPEAAHAETAQEATDSTGHEGASHGDDVPAAHDAETIHQDSGKDVTADNETNTAAEVAPIIPVEGPSIPLPVNLASGTWRVVDAAGNSFKITIDRSSPRGASKAVAEKAAETFEENFCIRTSAAGERWCFIRSYETATSKRVATEFFSPKQSAPGRECNRPLRHLTCCGLCGIPFSLRDSEWD